MFAVAVAYLLCRRLGAGSPASGAGAIAFGLSVTFWSQAVISEVYTRADRSEDFQGREIIEAVAGGTKPGSTVLYHGRSLHYMQLMEGRREDLKLVDPFYTADWVEHAESNLASGPVYVLYPGATNTRLYREAGYELRPVEEGMLYEVVERRE